MENNKRNFKQEFKDLWSENKDKVKIGVKCLGIGLLIGFVKGAITGMKSCDKTNSELIKKIPYEPDYDDFGDYIHDHMDELREYYEVEKELYE